MTIDNRILQGGRLLVFTMKPLVKTANRTPQNIVSRKRCAPRQLIFAMAIPIPKAILQPGPHVPQIRRVEVTTDKGELQGDRASGLAVGPLVDTGKPTTTNDI